MRFFTILMFLLGARLFLGGIDDIYRLATGKPQMLLLDGSRDPQQDTLLRAQVVLDNELFRHRPRVMALHTLVRLAVGLAYLFAVAAIWSRDTRGRRACLFAGWLGLAASTGNAAFVVFWVRRALPWIVPRLVEALAEDALRLGRPAPAADLVAEQAGLFLIGGPAALCVLGMALSVMLLAYFAGRRMRWFYGQSS
ncbi:MAG: hypothetical protein ABSB49_10415 [Polyangia bacterium]|jgi:hypothetical protein